MSTRSTGARAVSPAARVFSRLQADDALLPGQTSALRKGGALFLALLILGAVPFFWAANAAGLIGDLPAAVAKGSNSGPGGGDDDDDNSGPGGGDDDDDVSFLGTDDTSRNGHSTRGTTHDNDTRTRTQRGTDDTSRNNNSTRGTTRDNDTRTNTDNSRTGTRGGTQTRTRTGS